MTCAWEQGARTKASAGSGVGLALLVALEPRVRAFTQGPGRDRPSAACIVQMSDGGRVTWRFRYLKEKGSN